MLRNYLRTKLALAYENFILVFDPDRILLSANLMTEAVQQGFTSYTYNDPEEFRYLYELRLRDNKESKVLILVPDEKIYVPYDLRKRSYVVSLSLAELFPKLNTQALRTKTYIDLDLLYIAYSNYFGGFLNSSETEEFLKTTIYSRENAEEYVSNLISNIKIYLKLTDSLEQFSYTNWFEIAEKWAKARLLVDSGYAQVNLQDTSLAIDQVFQIWLEKNYRFLSASSSGESPVMVHRTLDLIHSRSKKAALLLIDGMSLENWYTFLSFAQGLPAQDKVILGNSFAIIPTVTSVSRQAIFSGKPPVTHPNPFGLANEEKQFREYLREAGYKNEDIYYGRGLNVELPPQTKIAGIIINTIDDIMHGQIQGQGGMVRDVRSWAESGELQNLIKGLLEAGFDIYITSDHGNIEATGQGKPGNEGLLTETTSQRARVYQDFALTDKVEKDFEVIKFPGTYLPKGFQYIIAKGYHSFTTKGKRIVCHGGTNIEEVIVPFVQIKQKPS
ncbi:MAG: BREX-3 system phosphatase PglZ [Desulfitobacteriia bacterium]|jgi:hypothetical protein